MGKASTVLRASLAILLAQQTFDQRNCLEVNLKLALLASRLQHRVLQIKLIERFKEPHFKLKLIIKFVATTTYLYLNLHLAV
jgi:hypothetical protein